MMNPENQSGSMQGTSGMQSGVADQVRDKASDVAQQAQQTAKQTANAQKGRVADSVGGIADALHHTGNQLDNQNQGSFAQVAHMAADRLDRLSNDLQNKSVDEMIGDLENFARREPGLFLGGAMVLGLVASRFLKSSASRSGQQYYGGQGRFSSGSQGYGFANRYGPGTDYGSTGAAREYGEADLAEYRRDALYNEYSGTPEGASYSSTTGNLIEDASGGTGYTGSSTTSPGGTTSSGYENPPSTKPGERPDYTPPRRTDQ